MYGGTEQPLWPKKMKNEKPNFQTNMSDSNRQVGQVDLTCMSYTLTIHLKHSNTYKLCDKLPGAKVPTILKA